MSGLPLFILFATIAGAAQAGDVSCKVVGVTDGDTITALCPGNEQVKVRLAEIDAPEKRQPFGTRSKQGLSDLCFGKQAEVFPQKTDRYGRTIARVKCEGQDASAHQVQAGMAWVYDRYVTDRSLYLLQDMARAGGRGLWVDAGPVPPWEWRKSKNKGGDRVSRNPHKPDPVGFLGANRNEPTSCSRVFL